MINRKKKNIKWDEKLLVDIYDLARSGLPDAGIASGLGMRLATFSAWRNKKESVKYALDKARNPKKTQVGAFEEYIHGRLTPELQDLWEEIKACDDSASAVARIEAMLEMGGKRVRQHLFVHSFIANNFILTPALRAVNIHIKVFRTWMKDEAFRDLMDQIHHAKKDFIEAPLLELVAEGHPQAVIFANKTVNQNRGYGTKLEVEHKGQIEHKHTMIDLDKLRLPLDVRIKILEAVDRQAELEEQKRIGMDVKEEDVVDADFTEVDEQDESGEEE